jgi:hypothetical protein
MIRFFFDYATKGQSLHDYGGDEFRDIDAAVEHAAVMAENLQFTLNGQWAGWWIEVRNAEGLKLSTVPIPAHTP